MAKKKPPANPFRSKKPGNKQRTPRERIVGKKPSKKK